MTWSEVTGVNYRVAGVANAPLSSEAAMRLVVQFEDGDDPFDVRVKNVFPPAGKDIEAINDFTTLNLRGKFLVEPDNIPGLSILATAEYQQGIDNAFNSFVDKPSVSGFRYRDRVSLYGNDIRIFDTEAWVGGLTATYALSSREELKSVTSYVWDNFASAPQSVRHEDQRCYRNCALRRTSSMASAVVNQFTGVVGASVTQDNRYYRYHRSDHAGAGPRDREPSDYADVAWNFAPRFDLLFGGRIDHRTRRPIDILR